MQYTMGPRWKAMRPRSSATAGLACTTWGRISKESTTLTPEAQRRLIGRYWPAVAPSTFFPFTVTLFSFDQPGMRTNSVNSSAVRGATELLTVAFHAYSVVLRRTSGGPL